MDKTEEDFSVIFRIVTGCREAEYPFCWVENAFVPGTEFYDAYEEIWNAREGLYRRFGLDIGDDDLERIMYAIMNAEEALGRRMFHCGMKYAQMNME